MSTRTPRGRTLALVAAVGVVAVAAVAAARLEQMATRYHLYRLESDGGYLEQLIDLPELSAAQEGALRSYCQTDEGGRAMFESFITASLGESRELATSSALDVELWIVLGSCIPVAASPRAQRLNRLHKLLQLLDGREFALERYPPWRFKVVWHGPFSRPASTSRWSIDLNDDLDGISLLWPSIIDLDDELAEMVERDRVVRAVRVAPSPVLHHGDHDPPP